MLTNPILLKKSLVFLRIVALLEGCSYLLLALTMVLKYKYLMPLPNYIVGMGHGILFVLYIILVFLVAYLHKWNLIKIMICLAASLVPFATFYVDAKILVPEIKKLENNELSI